MNEKKTNCSDCRFSCSLNYVGEYCEDCLMGRCILCTMRRDNSNCSDFKEDTEVSKYIKENRLDEDFIRHLYNIKENIFEMKLEDFKTLIEILEK